MIRGKVLNEVYVMEVTRKKGIDKQFGPRNIGGDNDSLKKNVLRLMDIDEWSKKCGV